MDRQPFTVVVLPDTQFYAESYPHLFLDQTRWITDQVEKRNIVAVIHEGDIVNKCWREEQWENADAALSVLDGVVPYFLALGNHD